MGKGEEQSAIEPDQHWDVDLFRPEDADGVVRLFLAVYGEEYPIRTYVEAARLKEENAKGLTISSVARTKNGDIVGHNALFRSAPHAGIYESGAGLVDARYRGGKGIFTRLVAHGQEVAAQKFGIEAIYGESVCNHVFSQKMTHGLGWITHAVQVDLMPASAYEKEKSAKGRVSVLLDMKILQSSPHPVHIPSAYRDPLTFIYEGLDDERKCLPSEKGFPSNTKTRMQVEVFDFAQVARVAFHEAGYDFTSAMDKLEQDLKEKDVQVVQVWLNLAQPWIGASVDVLRKRGFFLGGLLPGWFKTDGLLMQKTARQPHWKSIHIHFERAERLLKMVKEDWKKVRGTGEYPI
jgi:hypothetical protein